MRVRTREPASQATFTGTVSPAAAGALVALQVAFAASGERWHSVAWGHLADDGTFSIGHGFKTAGALSVRAIVHMRGNVVGVSEALTYTPTPPQNPQLTIQASADPVAYGTDVTISGTSAAHEAPVTLLARTRGGAPRSSPKARPTPPARTRSPSRRSRTPNTWSSAPASARRPLFEAVAFAITLAAPAGEREGRRNDRPHGFARPGLARPERLPRTGIPARHRLPRDRIRRAGRRIALHDRPRAGEAGVRGAQGERPRRRASRARRDGSLHAGRDRLLIRRPGPAWPAS